MIFKYVQQPGGQGMTQDPLKGIGNVVLVVSESAEEADKYVQTIGVYFNGIETGKDCSCGGCSDKWTSQADSEQIVQMNSIAELRNAFANDPGKTAYLHWAHPYSTKFQKLETTAQPGVYVEAGSGISPNTTDTLKYYTTNTATISVGTGANWSIGAETYPANLEFTSYKSIRAARNKKSPPPPKPFTLENPDVADDF